MINVYILNGPEIGRSFELKEGECLLGRSPQNDICIDDKTVSRKHLKIVVKEYRYFITDLKSRNRTFYGGEYLVPYQEMEIVEGAPIAIGMTVIGLGEKCKDKMAPYLETAALIGGSGVIGAMYLDSLKRPDGFRKEDLLDLLYIAQRIALAVESERFTADILDAMRNLANRDNA